MRKTFRRKKSKKRGTLKNYALLNKAGVINRFTTIRELIDNRFGSDLTPAILKSYAATRIARSYTRSRSSYAKSIIPFLKLLIMFDKHINVPFDNIDPVAIEDIRTKLLASMPDGMRLERYFNSELSKNLGANLIRLREKLTEPHPRKYTPKFNELVILLLDIKQTINYELKRNITIPPFTQ
jgi:hypothetical protein